MLLIIMIVCETKKREKEKKRRIGRSRVNVCNLRSHVNTYIDVAVFQNSYIHIFAAPYNTYIHIQTHTRAALSSEFTIYNYNKKQK